MKWLKERISSASSSSSPEKTHVTSTFLLFFPFFNRSSPLIFPYIYGIFSMNVHVPKIQKSRSYRPSIFIQFFPL